MSAAGHTSVRMRCDDLRDAPAHGLPPGYTVRGYRPGDEDAWVAIHRLADQLNPATPELFSAQFGESPGELSGRQLYLVSPAGQAVGTATAWFGCDRDGRLLGRVHWVAIVPAEQGRGLAKPLLSAVCRRLVERGHREAYLTTSTLRVPALNLYFAFGFLPDLRLASERAAWAALAGAVPAGPGLRPALRQWLRTHLREPGGPPGRDSGRLQGLAQSGEQGR